MTQPNPNWNPPRGPRHRYPQGRGHVQASSDPTPAPQILQPQSQPLPIQNSQSHSDPFQYNTQSTPYWNDRTGVVHNISSMLSRKPIQSSAQVASADIEATNKQQQPKQDAGLQPYLGHQWHTPYADIVGNGPYGQNQASYATSTSPASDPRLAVKENKSKRRDFTPYFDPADPRNHADLTSPNKYNILGTKDGNQKLHQDTTDVIKAATAKRDKMNTDKPLPLTPGSTSDTPRDMNTARDTHKSPTTRKPHFEIPTSPRLAKPTIASPSQPTDPHQPTPLSAIIEAPSPLKLSSQHQQQVSRKAIQRTPTLTHILALRAQEQQAKTLAALQGSNPDNPHHDDGSEKQHIPRALVKRISDSESRRLPRVTSREQKRHASEFIPGLEVEGKRDDWAGICMMADPAVRSKSKDDYGDREEGEDGDDASSSIYSSDDPSTQEDEIDRLIKAIAGLRPFQDLPSPSPTKNEFRRQSAVPIGLDMTKILTAKSDSSSSFSNDSKTGPRTEKAPREKTLLEVEAELLKMLNATGGGTGQSVVVSQGSSSAESFATASSEDYEQIGKEGGLVMEQNGVKRRWYKGFRKV